MDKDLTKRLGAVIRSIRTEKNISLELFAQKCKMSLNRAKRTENGEAFLTLSDLENIIKCLDIPLHELLKRV